MKHRFFILKFVGCLVVSPYVSVSTKDEFAVFV
jgi:hypothetical protein